MTGTHEQTIPPWTGDVLITANQKTEIMNRVTQYPPATGHRQLLTNCCSFKIIADFVFYVKGVWYLPKTRQQFTIITIDDQAIPMGCTFFPRHSFKK